MWICKTSMLVPESRKLMLTICFYIHNRRRSVYTFAVDKYRNKKLSYCVCSGLKNHIFPFCHMVKKSDCIGFLIIFFFKADKIGFYFTCILAIKSQYFFNTGICYLWRVIAQFDFRNKSTFSIAFGWKLVNTAEGRTVVWSDKLGSDTPVVYFCSLELKAHYKIFVEVTWRSYFCIGKAGGIKHFSCFLWKIGKVAAVKTDTKLSRTDAGIFHLLEDTDRIRHTGF